MLSRIFVIVMSVMAVLFVAATFVAFSSTGAGAQTKSPSPDASITQRVQNAFAADEALKTMEIHVETQDAVVNLSGFVRSLDHIDRAGEIARGVSGVAAVRNGLRVANRPSRA